MRRWQAIAAILAMQLFVATSASASKMDFTNGDKTNWDSPANGRLEAVQADDKYLYTSADVQWSKEQLGISNRRFYVPALKVIADRSDLLQPLVVVTNLPGAKFNKKLVDDGRGVEIKVTALDGKELTEDKSYTFSTSWAYAGGKKDNPAITLQSLQRFVQPGNGTVNDLTKTEDTLAGVEWKQLKAIDSKTRNTDDTSNNSGFFTSKAEEAFIKGSKVKSYMKIDSKEALEQFKKERKRLINLASPDVNIPFAITFDKAGIPSGLKGLFEENNLSVAQIYGEGTTEQGDKYTVSWFNADPNALSPIYPDSMKKYQFKSFVFTEIEGIATGKDLRNLSYKLSPGAVMDIEEAGQLPTGIHQLLERYSGKASE